MKNRSNIKRIKQKAWDKFREYILIRDGNKCVVCGSTDILQAGHVIPVGNMGLSIKFFEPDVFCQCRSCNAKHHWECEASLSCKDNTYYSWYLKKYGSRSLYRLYIARKRSEGLRVSWTTAFKSKAYELVYEYYQEKIDLIQSMKA